MRIWLGLRLALWGGLIALLGSRPGAGALSEGDRPEDPPVGEVLEGVPAGICVLLGVEDGALAAQVARGGRWLVHVLEPEPERRQKALLGIAAQGLGGQVSVEAWTPPQLPYPDCLVNRIVSHGGVPEAELLRALAPGGAAFVRRDGGWARIRKERPAEFDEWTHARHGADGNMVSSDRSVTLPSALRWVAGPAQDAGGKKWYYDHALVSSNGRNFYTFEDSIAARDAYNGVLLWTRPVQAHTFPESGVPLPENPTPKMKLGFRTSKVRPVAWKDRLYVATEGKVLALDASTGESIRQYGEARDPRELLAQEGMLIVTDSTSVRAYEAESAKLLWEVPVLARRIVAQGEGLFLVTGTHRVALARSSGRELWRKEDPDAERALTLSSGAGVLVLEKSTLRNDPIGCGIKVYRASDGEPLWSRDYQPDMTHYREARAYFAQGLLWLMVEKEGLLGLDPQTGSQRRQWGTRGKHCATPVATERFFMAPECEFTDLGDGTQTRARMFKSACRLPFVPANGLLYTFPVQCECYPMLRGYMGLSSGTPLGRAGDPRRVEGPALAPAPAAREDEASEWPIYRHDGYRSGSTPAAPARALLDVAWETRIATAPAGPLASDWKANPFVRGLLTAPVAAGGVIFLAAPDLHQVIAVGAKDGQTLWAFTAGARVDGPPTVHGGLCLFGCHDGWVYALRAQDGLLAWRFRAAPEEARILAYGQMESPWPVVGSVLVRGDLAFVAAGRHPSVDGGVRLLALRWATGEKVWEANIDNLDAITKWYGGTLPTGPGSLAKIKVGLDFEPVDMLVQDGEGISMSRWQIRPADGEFKLVLDSVHYRAPGDLQVPRGLWGYGIRQTKQVQPKPPAAFDRAGIHTGRKDDVAVILAGGQVIRATAGGELEIGGRLIDLKTPPVFDGLIAAYGALYVATEKGTLLCLR
jgi:outer membrane protein assembly factor BamB